VTTFCISLEFKRRIVTVPPKKTSTESEVYSVEEAGRILGLSLNTAYRAVHNGEIPSIKIGGIFRVPKAALHRLIEPA
jgi:excisionase family DNA binding protein